MTNSKLQKCQNKFSVGSRGLRLLFVICFSSFSIAQNSDTCSIFVNGKSYCPPEDGTLQCEPPDPQNEPVLEGYGTDSSFGGGPGFETCEVNNLNNSGAGSFRQCIENRNGSTNDPTPRTIVFNTSGTILLTTDLRIRQPYLTIDGLSAPSPGITIAKTGSGEDGETRLQTWPAEQTCAHDVLIQGLRFQGVWGRDTEDHSQNADMIQIDGEDYTGCMNNIVIWRNTFIDGQDAVGGYWGSVTNSTFGYNFLVYNYHPQQISHSETGSNQERQFFSIHHNVYAYAHERILNIRGNVWDLNMEQNVFHKWDAFNFPGGYGTLFRCRNNGCPRRINLIENHWTSGGVSLSNAIDYSDNASPTDVYMEGNIIPASETDIGQATQEFARTDSVTLFPDDTLTSFMFPYVGHPFPTNEEAQVLQEVQVQVETEVMAQ